MPLSALSSCGVSESTAVQLFYGTSQAGNLDTLNKDYYLGSTVSFANVATIRFGGGLEFPKSATVVSGPNPPRSGRPRSTTSSCRPPTPSWPRCRTSA